MIKTALQLSLFIYSGFAFAEEEHTDPVVEALLESMGYMNETQIREFYQRVQKSERMNALLSAGSAKGAARSVEIDFLKSQTSIVMHLSANRVTAIQVIDQNGQPWAINDLLPAPKDSIEIKTIGTTGSMLAITPLERHIRGNAIMSLSGIEQPINIHFETNTKSYDEPLTIKVRDTYHSPNLPTSSNGEPSSSQGYTDADLQYVPFLEGVIPESAREIAVTAPFDIIVWKNKDELIIKTEGELLYPGYRYRREKGDINLFIVEPIEFLQFTYAGSDSLVTVEY